jgi:hypothetical protein
MRKKILDKEPSIETFPDSAELDIPAIATALLTSEDPEHPVENAFDGRRGRGSTRWVAGSLGEQTLILVFDTPQMISHISLEVEEQEVSRTQELELSVSSDDGQTYRELRRQEYNFSPPDTTFQREVWAVTAEHVTHLRLRIKPDKGNRPCQATLTSLVLRTSM